jgi:hypothetical protein
MTEEEALKALSERDLSLDLIFSETANEGYMDFARCQRADGSFYGTGGQCRKGKESGAKEEEPAKPRQRRAAEPEPKKKAGAEPSKAEEKGYKPKEREERKGLRGLKDRILGGKGKKDLDSLVPSKEEILKARDGYKQIIGDRLTRNNNQEERERLFKSLERADKNAALEIARMGTNKKFAQDLKSNLPPKVKVAIDKENGELVLTQKVGKNTIETTFNQSQGFNYRVNGKYDAGSVKDRKEQLRVAMAVRGQYDAIVRSLPEGTVIKTSPYDGDGGGAARQKAYEKIGFGKPNEIQEMFAMKKDGKMVPSTKDQQNAAFENPDTVWFKETSDKGADEKESIRAWMEIITGKEIGGSE